MLFLLVVFSGNFLAPSKKTPSDVALRLLPGVCGRALEFGSVGSFAATSPLRSLLAAMAGRGGCRGDENSEWPGSKIVTRSPITMKVDHPIHHPPHSDQTIGFSRGQRPAHPLPCLGGIYMLGRTPRARSVAARPTEARKALFGGVQFCLSTGRMRKLGVVVVG